MDGTSEAIDLTQSPPSLPVHAADKGKARLIAEPVDLTSDSEAAAAGGVAQHEGIQHNQACCNGTCLPSSFPAASSSSAALRSAEAPAGQSRQSVHEPEICCSTMQLRSSGPAAPEPIKRKRKRVQDTEEVKQKKVQDREEAKQKKLQAAADKAARKAAAPKRVNAAGKTVMYAARPSQKTRERIERAMPSEYICPSPDSASGSSSCCVPAIALKMNKH